MTMQSEQRVGRGLGSSLLCVVGARPNLMKIAPIMAAMQKIAMPVPVKLVHTGQHYDAAMNDRHFQALGIPQPDISLEVGSGSHAAQTAEVMKRFEPVVLNEKASAVLVVGDVNSTIACALVAAKLNVPVIHVEAGLRSFDRGMPEEINRVLTDQISDLLFTTESSAHANLQREGIAAERVHFVGNVMIDTLMQSLQHAVAPQSTLQQHKLDAAIVQRPYAVLTLHRPSNVDDRAMLGDLLTVVNQISRKMAVVFPVHPRTRGKIQEFGLQHLLDSGNIALLPPVDYLEMLGLVRGAQLVLTDSGGLQEETTALGVPCITLRENTERPITAEEGTNTLAGRSTEKILAIFEDTLATGGKRGRVPHLWDGKAAQRIATVLKDWLQAAA